MTLVRYNSEAQKPFSNLFDRFFSEVANENRYYKFLPDVDFVETEKAFEIHAAVPGLNKSDFNIEVAEGLLVVSGERKFLNEDKSKTYHAVETKYGSFSRSFKLPANADTANIEAEYINGILKISVPKDAAKILKAKIEVK
ncbi:MAG: Hsp20/alpha crystallin family protein [Cytophagales bacterium]